MVRCLSCNLDNDKNETTCRHCGTTIPNEMNMRIVMSSDQLNTMKFPDIRNRFSIKGFLEENYRLFTILGIFGALSYYLTNLSQKIPEYNISSLASNVTTTSAITNPSWIPPTLLLEFGTLMSYLVFVGVLVILIIETFKHEKNIQRSLFIYCLFFLGSIVAIYSIIVLTTIIPYFVFISTIYFCGLIFSTLYDNILKTSPTGIRSLKVELYAILLVAISLVLSFVILFILSKITSNYSPVQESDWILNILIYFLLGLVIGIFFVGSSIVMIRFTTGVITAGQSSRNIILFALVFLIVGVVLWITNYLNFGGFGPVCIFYTVIILSSLGIDHIKVKYSLKF